MKTRDAFLGLAVGDALGVPLEFRSRESLALRPCSDMTGNGTHHQPPGTWSDDSALSFCLAEALIDGYSPDRIAANFIRWETAGYWSARGGVFDIGNTTRRAIGRMKAGVPPLNAGDDTEDSNGNGSLMRILPLVFYVEHLPIAERFRITREVSSLTHRHPRSCLACFLYIEFARGVLAGMNAQAAYGCFSGELRGFLDLRDELRNETGRFVRILEGDIARRERGEISSSGYVVHTLEAALWCVLRNTTYEATVLEAVNLGEDTDTTAAVAGGLAGLLYGADAIPSAWRSVIARAGEIEDLARRAGANVIRR